MGGQISLIVTISPYSHAPYGMWGIGFYNWGGDDVRGRWHGTGGVAIRRHLALKLGR